MNPVTTVWLSLIDVSVPNEVGNVTINFAPAGVRTMTVQVPYSAEPAAQIIAARPLIEAEVKTLFPDATTFVYMNFGSTNPETVAAFAERRGAL